ncbi:MAG: carbohydrate kinase [Chloroflexi bacterium]|nr:carbohydrate kinase [Chloroflexota bacterium]
MEKGYVASYDFGTSGVKAVLIDFNGFVIDFSTVSYSLITPKLGWAEQNPSDFWEAVCEATKQVVKKTSVNPIDIKAVVFSTQWKGIIPLDKDDNILYNAIIWLDSRAAAQADKLNKRLSVDIFCAYDYWARLMWLKEERPDIYGKTKCFLEVNGYLKFKATGNKSTDLTNDFIHSANESIQKQYDAILNAGELNPDLFPPMVLPTEEVGKISEKAAIEMGLSVGTPVYGGCGDIPAIAIGAGCSDFNKGHLYLGSSGWFCTVVPERSDEVGELYQSLSIDKELLGLGMQSVGMSFNWAINQLYHVEKEILGSEIYNFINKQVETVEPGCNNLVATPWIHGERPPLSSNAKCVFFNLTNMHDRRHMVRAIMEGVCFTLKWKLIEYQKASGNCVNSVRAVGGGACSDPWMQMMADILNITVEIPLNPQHAGAIGAAYCAFIGMGLVDDFTAADEKIIAVKRFQPRNEYHQVYSKLFEIFKQIYPRMKDLFEVLNS